MTDDGAIPVTLLGGYLGAGKTTLVNAILRALDVRRIVVVVNDFGEINIDEELIQSRAGNTIGLANGCICCSLNDGMLAVIDQIRSMRPPPSHVLIEVSGVGDPGAAAAWADHPGLRRQRVIVCADVHSVQRKAHDRWAADTVRAQLRSADVLLLTKTDLADDAQIARARAWLRGAVPHVPVMERLPADVGSLLDDAPSSNGQIVPVGHIHDGNAVAQFTTWLLTAERPVERACLDAVFARLTEAVVRVKGVVQTAENPERRTLVNVVDGRNDVTDGGPWRREDRGSRLVVITTRQFDEDDVAQLQRWLVSHKGDPQLGASA